MFESKRAGKKGQATFYLHVKDLLSSSTKVA